VREVDRAREPRTVISSEFLSDAPRDRIPIIVADLDPARVHVAVTLRPLARIIPSQWQQFVQGGSPTAFDDFLRSVFAAVADDPAPLFWHRHRHDRLIARWAEVVGPRNVTVVVADDRDHSMVLRTFERLLGLRTGTLHTPPDRTNRSMTLPETEAVRAFNRLAREQGVGTPLLAKVMRYGASQYIKLRVPEPDEPRVETPQWALDRASEVAREMVGNISASGVRVIGDLESLAAVQRGRPAADHQPDVTVPPPVAARVLVGVAIACGLARGAPDRGPTRSVDPDGTFIDAVDHLPRPTIDQAALDRVSTPRIGGVLKRRSFTALEARRHALRRRLRWGTPRG
jgi:hypothetical protein